MTIAWTGRRVLVTGSAGFIGSHLVEALVVAGASVTAFIHYNSRGDRGNLGSTGSHILREVEIVAGDIRDATQVAKAVRSSDVVFHLAALIGIPLFWRFLSERDDEE